MTRDEMKEIAKGNIERNLGNVCTGDADADLIYDEAYTLAFDALSDKGVSNDIARSIASEVAQPFAQL